MPITKSATERKHWIFRDPCGCAFGVLDVGPETDTRSKAWREFYATATERNAAMDRDVTANEVSHAIYVAEIEPMMRREWVCPHITIRPPAAEVAP